MRSRPPETRPTASPNASSSPRSSFTLAIVRTFALTGFAPPARSEFSEPQPANTAAARRDDEGCASHAATVRIAHRADHGAVPASHIRILGSTLTSRRERPNLSLAMAAVTCPTPATIGRSLPERSWCRRASPGLVVTPDFHRSFESTARACTTQRQTLATRSRSAGRDCRSSTKAALSGGSPSPVPRCRLGRDGALPRAAVRVLLVAQSSTRERARLALRSRPLRASRAWRATRPLVRECDRQRPSPARFRSPETHPDR